MLPCLMLVMLLMITCSWPSFCKPMGSPFVKICALVSNPCAHGWEPLREKDIVRSFLVPPGTKLDKVWQSTQWYYAHSNSVELSAIICDNIATFSIKGPPWNIRLNLWTNKHGRKNHMCKSFSFISRETMGFPPPGFSRPAARASASLPPAPLLEALAYWQVSVCAARCWSECENRPTHLSL